MRKTQQEREMPETTLPLACFAKVVVIIVTWNGKVM